MNYLISERRLQQPDMIHTTRGRNIEIEFNLSKIIFQQNI